MSVLDRKSDYERWIIGKLPHKRQKLSTQSNHTTCFVLGVPDSYREAPLDKTLSSHRPQHLILNEHMFQCFRLCSFFPLLLACLPPPCTACCLKNPVCSSNCLAVLFINPNLAGPSKIPPNHLDTTTTTFTAFVTCNKCSNRPPAAASPSSSKS